MEEYASDDRDALLAFAKKVKYPVVAKVVGPVHKSDIGGVALNIRGEEHLLFEYERMMRLPGVTGIMVQPMLKGQELFLGAKYEDRFGHVVLCGLGGIFVEVLKDVSYGLAPLSYDETYSMIRAKGHRRATICGHYRSPLYFIAFCQRDKRNGYKSVGGYG